MTEDLTLSGTLTIVDCPYMTEIVNELRLNFTVITTIDDTFLPNLVTLNALIIDGGSSLISINGFNSLKDDDTISVQIQVCVCFCVSVYVCICMCVAMLC